MTKTKIFVLCCWGLLLLALGGSYLLFRAIAHGRLGFMPTFEELENPKRNQASEVFSADGQLLATFYIENRNPVSFEEISPYAIQALIAREDHRFYEHAGIDGIGLVRVAVKTLLMRQSGEGGGSTITQQLAKNLFPRDTTRYTSSFQRYRQLTIDKLREWVTAVKLERNYTKDEILTWYLNTVPFGHEAYGIKTAARTFFNKTPDSLKVEEAALLIGLLKGPTRYSPVRNPERSLVRRNGVLEKMKEHGYLTRAELDSISALPITLQFQVQDHLTGTGTYFREFLRLTMSRSKPVRSRYANPDSYREDSVKWFTNPLYGWCNKNFKPDGTPYNLYRDGLKIYTTLDSRMQQYAEEAVAEHMKYLQANFFKEKKNSRKAPFSNDLTMGRIDTIMRESIRQSIRYTNMRRTGMSDAKIMQAFKEPVEMEGMFSWDGEFDTIMTPYDSILYYKHYLRSGMMSMDPRTGHVKAYVGGIDFKHFKWDAVTVQKRQVGSTFKPFLYTLALQDKKELTPCYEVLNIPQTFIDNGKPWTPRSSGNSEDIGKRVTLKWGLAKSENNISAWIIKQVTPKAVADMAHKMGITSYIDPVPSIVYGTSDISVAEMVTAYCVFANKGVYTEPVFVTRIEDKNGNALMPSYLPRTEEVISERTAYMMVNLLQGVVDGGTAVRLRLRYNFTNEIGGKTGTTNEHSDGWFMGITPTLVSGVWVGGEERSIHFDAMSRGQAAEEALPIWALYMKKVYADKRLGISQGPFDRPADMTGIDCEVDAPQPAVQTGGSRYEEDF